jgi:hypothetical protein
MTPALGSSRGDRDALVILVGVTADRRKRQYVEAYFQEQRCFEVFVPGMPQWLGLGFCRHWLRRYLHARLAGKDFGHVHFLNYISGGFVFRSIASDCDFLRLGRIVYDRAPIQEELPRLLATRYTTPGLVLARGKMLADLASERIHSLPFPGDTLEQGLIVEGLPSALAQQYGLSRNSPPPAAWDWDRLLPHAADVIELPLSHDDVYDSELFLSQANAFYAHGTFRRSPGDHADRGAAEPP